MIRSKASKITVYVDLPGGFLAAAYGLDVQDAYICQRISRFFSRQLSRYLARRGHPWRVATRVDVDALDIQIHLSDGSSPPVLKEKLVDQFFEIAAYLTLLKLDWLKRGGKNGKD